MCCRKEKLSEPQAQALRETHEARCREFSLPEELFGFNPNHCIEDAHFCLMESIKYNRNLNRVVILLS